MKTAAYNLYDCIKEKLVNFESFAKNDAIVDETTVNLLKEDTRQAKMVVAKEVFGTTDEKNSELTAYNHSIKTAASMHITMSVIYSPTPEIADTAADFFTTHIVMLSMVVADDPEQMKYIFEHFETRLNYVRAKFKYESQRRK